ncbi:MAG: hypothetical protein ACE5FT_01730 [Candidatus Nanoarchaeia archaeon]
MGNLPLAPEDEIEDVIIEDEIGYQRPVKQWPDRYGIEYKNIGDKKCPKYVLVGFYVNQKLFCRDATVYLEEGSPEHDLFACELENELLKIPPEKDGLTDLCIFFSLSKYEELKNEYK